MADNFNNPEDLDKEAERRALLNLASQGSVVPEAPEYADQLPSKTESFLQGAASIPTLGWGPELSAAYGALAFPTATDEALGRDYGERWSAIRDQLKKEKEEAQMANPGSYTGGQLTGGGLTAAAMPFATSSIPAAAGSLAAYGAIQGAGEAGEGKRLEGAYEGAKSALKAPYELAKVTGEKLGAGELGGAAGTGVLTALSVLPFALKGKPVSGFVEERALNDINHLMKQANSAIDKGEIETAKTIFNTLKKHEIDNAKAIELYKNDPQSANLADRVRRETGMAVDDLKERLHNARRWQVEQTRRTVRGARQAAEELRTPKSNITSLDVERAQRTPNVAEAEKRALQITDESGQVHTITPGELKDMGFDFGVKDTIEETARKQALREAGMLDNPKLNESNSIRTTGLEQWAEKHDRIMQEHREQIAREKAQDPVGYEFNNSNQAQNLLTIPGKDLTPDQRKALNLGLDHAKNIFNKYNDHINDIRQQIADNIAEGRMRPTVKPETFISKEIRENAENWQNKINQFQQKIQEAEQYKNVIPEDRLAKLRALKALKNKSRVTIDPSDWFKK